MSITNLKTKIATALGITLSLGIGVQVNVNIQTQEFYEQLADGKLYVNAFNQGAYKEVRSELTDQMDEYLAGGEPLTYQALQMYMKVISKEAGEDTYIATDNVYKEENGILVVVGTEEVERQGWKLASGTDDDFLRNLNNKLKDKLTK